MRQSSFWAASARWPRSGRRPHAGVCRRVGSSDSQSSSDSALAYADERGAAFPIKAPPPFAPAPPTVFWAQGIGAWGRLEGNGNAADVRRNLAGVFAGADRRFGTNWLAGLAGGYTNSSFGIADLASSANINTAHLAGYAGANFGPWNLRGAAAGTFSTLDTGRSIVFPGFSRQRECQL